MAGAAGAIKAGGAYVEFFIQDRVTRQIDKIGKKIRSAGASMTRAGAGLAAGALAVASPFALTIQKASELEETMNKFNVVFGDNAGAVKQWGDEYASQVGRSKKQIADFMAGTQDLLVPLGFDEGAATEMSKQVTQLAVDLASFNNMADEDSLRDLQAALTGSGEVMKKYGVVLDEAAVKQELFQQGIDPKTATNQQKAYARMQIIMRGTTAAQGDAVRSAGSFANQMKALKGRLDDAAAALGTHLLPMVTPLVTKAGKIVAFLGEWIAKNKALVTNIAKVVAIVGAIGVALTGLGIVVSIIGTGIAGLGTLIGGAFAVITTVLGAVLSPIGLVIAAVVGLAAAWATMTDSGRETVAGLMTWFGQLKDYATDTWQGIAAALKAGDLKLAAKIAWIELKLIWERGVDYLSNIWHSFTDLAISVFDNVITWIRSAWAKLTGWLGQQIAKVIAFFTGEDPTEMANAVQQMTDAQVAELQKEKAAREQERQAAADARGERNAQELEALRKERDQALQEARDLAQQSRSETAELAKTPDPKAAGDAVAQVEAKQAQLDSVEFGVEAFKKFDEARRGLEEKQLAETVRIRKAVEGGGLVMAEAGT